MAKKFFILTTVIFALVAGVWYVFSGNNNFDRLADEKERRQCRASELIYYYRDQCGWCQKVAGEKILEKIEDLGVRVTKINASVGPINHNFTGVPAFVIDEKVYSGYQDYDALANLLGCKKIL